MFIDFSSAFSTIIPQQLIHILVQLGLNTSLCSWLLDFLTGRPQAVRVSSNTSSTITLNTGPSRMFADDTTVVGLITNKDETDYRSEVSRLAGWCKDNLSLNVEKTKEIVVDFRRARTQHAPLTINGATVERVSSTKFLGVHITENLSWTASLAKKSQQRLYFLRKLESQSPGSHHVHLLQRHHREHSDELHHCVVWHLQRVLPKDPPTHNIYSTCLTRKALCIVSDPTHPTHSFFSHAAITEETVESSGQDQQTEGQLHPPGCQEAQPSPGSASTPLFCTMLKLSPSPPSRVTVSRSVAASSSSSRSSRAKRKRVEVEDEMPSTPSFHVSQHAEATGSISIEELDLEGKSVTLKNNSNKDQSLGSWRLKRRVGEGDEIAYKFSPKFVLKAGQTVTVWAADAGVAHSPPSDLLWKSQSSWGSGDETVTLLISSDGEEVAKRMVTKSVIELENGDDENGDFGNEDLFHQQGDPKMRSRECAVM
ncbi:hypothetical protein PDJAM_G00026540 [Pangasius djambal]|uniref:Uncharacterized protein n=1 Tax=Pangasius djambal TaxID=1691987 RepID=A0ACC5YRU1_9TELE|nr:hypothetical protein [Pangasius djambal]